MYGAIRIDCSLGREDPELRPNRWNQLYPQRSHSQLPWAIFANPRPTNLGSRQIQEPPRICITAALACSRNGVKAKEGSAATTTRTATLGAAKAINPPSPEP